MGHHGSEPFDDPEHLRRLEKSHGEKLENLKKKLLDTSAFRGALGDFPDGQLTSRDEGAIQFAIGDTDGKVVIDFGTPVAWLGMSPQQAADFAAALLERARLVARRSQETVSFSIR